MNTTVTAAIIILILLMVFGGQSKYDGPTKYIKKGQTCNGLTCTSSMCDCNN